MALDAFKNFAKGTASTGYAAGATSIVLTTGHGARMPAGATNYTWWNSTDYTDPSDDPDKEIIRGTISSDTIGSITRGQEGTSDVAHNTGGKTYSLLATLTAKTLNTDLLASLAPLGSAYVTIGADGTLSNERALTGTANQVVVTDNGAGSTVVLSTPQNLHTSATWQAATLSLGSALQRSSLFEIKEATAASLTAGSAYATISKAGANTLLAMLHTGFSTDLGNALTFDQSSAGYVTIGNGLGSLATANKGNSIEFNHAGRQLVFKPGTSTGLMTLGLASISHNSAGTEFGQTALTVWGRTDVTNGYFNPVFRFGHTNGTNFPFTYEIGAEGFDVGADGPFTGAFGRWYLWSDADQRNIMVHDFVNDRRALQVGGTSATPGGHSLEVWGRFSLDWGANDPANTALGAFFGGFLNKTDTATLHYFGTNITPTINTGGSQSGASFTVLNLDTINTSVVGVTTDLIKASYGSTPRMILTSGGLLGIGTGSVAPIAKLEVHSDGTSGNDQIRNLHSSDSAASPSVLLVKSRGTAATPLRVQASDNVAGLNAKGHYAVDNTTTATLGSTVGQFQFYAAESFTSTAQGTNFRLNLVPVGSTAAGVAWGTSSEKVLKINPGVPFTLRGTTEGTSHLDIFDGTPPVGTLANGISFYSASGIPKVMDAAGVVTVLKDLSNANTSDVTANAADTYLTGSNLAIGGMVKAGTILRWRISATKTAAGTATPTFSVRFGTAGTTSDTARVTFITSAQTAATDTGHFDLTVVIRSLSATSTAAGVLNLTHLNSTTGLASANETEVYVSTSGTFDNTGATLIAGVSINPGTAGVWTIQVVAADSRNLT